MSFQCELKEPTVQPALTIRARAPVEKLTEVFNQGYCEIIQYLGEMGQGPAGPMFGVYYNMDMRDLDIEFGFPVAQAIAGKGRIQAAKTPEGKVAACLHVGPYQEVEPTYAALMKWIKDNGHEPAGVGYEIYLNDPNDTPPEKLETQVCLMLK